MYGYPDGWPACPNCGEPAMDGHITCGKVQCDERGARDVQRRIEEIKAERRLAEAVDALKNRRRAS